MKGHSLGVETLRGRKSEKKTNICILHQARDHPHRRSSSALGMRKQAERALKTLPAAQVDGSAPFLTREIPRMAEILAVQGFRPLPGLSHPKGPPISLAGTGVPSSPQPRTSVQAGERGSPRALLKSPNQQGNCQVITLPDHSH